MCRVPRPVEGVTMNNVEIIETLKQPIRPTAYAVQKTCLWCNVGRPDCYECETYAAAMELDESASMVQEEVRVPLYGRASNRWGRWAVRVPDEHVRLLVGIGWAYLGRSPWMIYHAMQPLVGPWPRPISGPKAFVNVQILVPAEDAIERVRQRASEAGIFASGVLCGCPWTYSPAHVVQARTLVGDGWWLPRGSNAPAWFKIEFPLGGWTQGGWIDAPSGFLPPAPGRGDGLWWNPTSTGVVGGIGG